MTCCKHFMGWRSIWWASYLHFWWKCWPVALIVGLHLSFLLQVFCFFFSLLSGLCLQIIWVVQVLMRRGHLLSSLLITLELWQGEPRERTEPIRISLLKINTSPEKNDIDISHLYQVYSKLAVCSMTYKRVSELLLRCNWNGVVRFLKEIMWLQQSQDTGLYDSWGNYANFYFEWYATLKLAIPELWGSTRSFLSGETMWKHPFTDTSSPPYCVHSLYIFSKQQVSEVRTIWYLFSHWSLFPVH